MKQPTPLTTRVSLVAVLTVAVCQSVVRAQPAGWSAPVDISQAPEPATALATVVDSNNTTHVIFWAIPGVGTLQLWHTYMEPGQPWSAPAQVSHTDAAAILPVAFPTPATGLEPHYYYSFFQEDQAGILHLFFESVPGVGVQQVWHTELDINDLSAGWSAPVNISQATQPATALAVVIDSNNTVHVVFWAIPGVGTLQLWHTYKELGQTWSAPVQVSHTGAVAILPPAPPTALGFDYQYPYEFLQEDQAGMLHLCFESIPGAGVQQVWHLEFDINDLSAGWSAPVNISQATQPATAVATVIDSNNTIHVIFWAIPGVGTLQLWHTYREPGQSWSTPVQVSHTPQGATLPVALSFLLPVESDHSYSFFQEDQAGILHLFFESIPGVGVQQVWHTETDVNDLAGGWSNPVDISQSPQPATAMAMVIDSNNTVHVVFWAIPGVGTLQLWHTYKEPGQPWSNPEQVSHTAMGATLPPALPYALPSDYEYNAYAFFQEDQAGILHLFFESVPGVGVQQVWHTELDINDLSAGWSAPVDISQAPEPATALAVVFDSNNTIHVIFWAIPGVGTLQLWHTYKEPGQSWSPPERVSHTDMGATLPPALPLALGFGFGFDYPYAFFQEDQAGLLHLFFETIPGAGVQQVWHTTLDIGGPVPGPLGDLNCDGFVDVQDVEPFILALLDPAGYAAAFPNCDVTMADLSGNGTQDGEDIQFFMDLLVQP